MADPFIDDDGQIFCPYPDCDRGSGGKPFLSEIAARGHFRKHEAAEARASANEAKAAETPKIPRSKAKQPPLDARVAASLATIGLGAKIIPIGQPGLGADGTTLIKHSQNLANALVDYGQENATVLKACELIAGGGALSALVFALFSFGIEIAENHGWVKRPPVAKAGEPQMPSMADIMRQMQEMTPEQAAEMAKMGQAFMGGQPLRPPPSSVDGAAEVRVA
jgi:hypothetical protein